MREARWHEDGAILNRACRIRLSRLIVTRRLSGVYLTDCFQPPRTKRNRERRRLVLNRRAARSRSIGLMTSHLPALALEALEVQPSGLDPGGRGVAAGWFEEQSTKEDTMQPGTALAPLKGIRNMMVDPFFLLHNKLNRFFDFPLPP